jgi:beta-lactamase class A
MRLGWFAPILALLSACGAPLPITGGSEAGEPELAAIERRTGGRLGVALVDAEGRRLIGHRENERFAMCSTFKLPMAAMVLAGAAEGRWPLDEGMPIGRDDIVSHSPVSERFVARGELPMARAAQAILVQSDNAAANLLMRRTGGPEALTRWLRGVGDRVTRLDRYELELNENARGDPRDTTSPLAMAQTTAGIVHGESLAAADRTRLRGWTTDSRTGMRRIRATLPAAWPAGDKTGSCGNAFNDIAWFDAPNGVSFVLTVYLDRPRVSDAQAEAAIADVARALIPRLR